MIDGNVQFDNQTKFLSVAHQCKIDTETVFSIILLFCCFFSFRVSGINWKLSEEILPQNKKHSLIFSYYRFDYGVPIFEIILNWMQELRGRHFSIIFARTRTNFLNEKWKSNGRKNDFQNLKKGKIRNKVCRKNERLNSN